MQADKQSQLQRRVFLSGMFDMRNFGDLMFPLIARARLPGVEIVPVSPTGAATGFSDAMASVPLQEMLSGEIEANGIVVGGGYVIHSHKMHFLEEYGADGLTDFAGPGLWLGATLAACIRDIPLAWNAPGVPHPFAQNQRGIVDAALRAADYLSVRDTGSAELLDAPADLPPHIVPDPVADIALVWKPEMLAAPFHAFIARKRGDAQARYLALHFRNRSLAGLGVPAAAKMIDDFSLAHDLCPILIAVGQTHADDVLAREIAPLLHARHIVLDDPASLIEIAAVIGMSRLYVGASLHGYVTAAAYGVPGVLVAKPSYRKFQGFLDHTGRLEDLAQDWVAAFDIAAHRVNEKSPTRIPPSVFTALDAHWKHIGDALSSPDRYRNRRHAFLRSWLRAGMDAGGAVWPHLPYMRRSVASSSRGGQ